MIENDAKMTPRLRPGRDNPRALYLQMGAEPDKTVDLPIGFFIDTDAARLIGEGLTSRWHLNEIRLDAEARSDEPRLEARREAPAVDTYVGVRTEDPFKAERWES